MVVPLLTTLVIRIGAVSIRMIRASPTKVKQVESGFIAALKAVGIKASAIDTYTTTAGRTIRVTGTRAELKAAAIAATAYAVAAKDVVEKIIPKKPAVHKRKYKLTRKQAAKLKKSGYVYITRNKKQVKITR